jgi:hypothetical protein
MFEQLTQKNGNQNVNRVYHLFDLKKGLSRRWAWKGERCPSKFGLKSFFLNLVSIELDRSKGMHRPIEME